MSYRICIVAHPDRTTTALALSKHVKADHISFDTNQQGCEANHLTALQWHYEHSRGWAVTLEDDAQPVQGFRQQLSQALAVAPTPIVSLYLGRLRPPQHQPNNQALTAEADQQDACWITTPHLMHAVGYAINTDLLPALLAYRNHEPIDQRVTAWALDNQQPISYTWPSLIDHDDQLPTLAYHPDGHPRTPGRRAWRTGTRTQWTSATVTTAVSTPCR